MAHECTKERFLEGVKKHELTIINDNGVYRHIKMAMPDSGNMYYEILTFPQYLVYVGDMGSYTFCRTEDMFRFFRRDDLGVNPHYWHEKVQAMDRNNKCQEFSMEDLTETLKQLVDDHFEFESDKSDKAAVWADIESEILRYEDDGEHQLRIEMDCFKSHGFDLEDYAWKDYKKYTYHFIWCLYAIVYAIQQYDEVKSPAESADKTTD